MSLVLARVDDRLIHGQVVVGWGKTLGIRYIVLVDDKVRASDWEQDLYRMGVPPHIEVIFASVGEAAQKLTDWAAEARVGILLVGDIDTVARLCEASPDLKHVNVGGMHAGPGREERLPYVFMSPSEADTLRRLESKGVSITAQDVPTARPVSLRDLVGVTA